MTGDLPLFGQAIRRTFTPAGRARRTEMIVYVVASQLLCVVLLLLARLFLAGEALAWLRFAVFALAIVPLFSLSARRLHDFGQSGKWTVLLWLVVVRSIGLDLAARLGGSDTRALIESPLSYVDWLLFLPFAWLYITLLIVPGKKGANRHGPDPRYAPDSKTAGPENPEPAV
ncbi:DUF805 domain-containing protein [Novosphingobium mangrovi (ex Huang et al. 2023)]|uniref:DUF805 domain-containing protein n=1 Tax=Novosphingobium mangrovi (ex Huang et al. 2023) TaxID=2976432 RepID=A0ABT2I3U4_9SPHN|nr:DUF805 domain-containing protein [Novosphingobium mangrovi (ex Huang et al. 2023)]MCT2399482.1 DUF805 domain-containing protein [Novosphingobium mangrovi (ex Huang et al. 2023)]